MNLFELIIVQPIFNLLLFIYSIVPFADFGVAVILFTILVRFALYPLVVKQLHQAKAMRKLQPELARIKKASKGNKQLEGVQMLELYKKYEIKPFQSMLVLLIQLPIFIALFRVIQVFTTHRDEIAHFTYPFMQNIEVVKDLIAHPDSFNKLFLGFMDLTQPAFSKDGVDIILILLAAVAAYTQYIISKQTSPQTTTKRFRDVLAESGDGQQPDQSELNAVMMSKMTKIMPFMMFFIMLGLPGALALYYVTSNLFAAIQQHYLLKRDTEEMEAIADKSQPASGKKATAKARAREAREAETVTDTDTSKGGFLGGAKAENVTRISAKDSPRKKKEKA